MALWHRAHRATLCDHDHNDRAVGSPGTRCRHPPSRSVCCRRWVVPAGRGQTDGRRWRLRDHARPPRRIPTSRLGARLAHRRHTAGRAGPSVLALRRPLGPVPVPHRGVAGTFGTRWIGVRARLTRRRRRAPDRWPAKQLRARTVSALPVHRGWHRDHADHPDDPTGRPARHRLVDALRRANPVVDGVRRRTRRRQPREGPAPGPARTARARRGAGRNARRHDHLLLRARPVARGRHRGGQATSSRAPAYREVRRRRVARPCPNLRLRRAPRTKWNDRDRRARPIGTRSDQRRRRSDALVVPPGHLRNVRSRRPRRCSRPS